jgi:hypothetical protein
MNTGMARHAGSVETITSLQEETHYAESGSSPMAVPCFRKEVRGAPYVGLIARNSRGDWLITGFFYRAPATVLEKT